MSGTTQPVKQVIVARIRFPDGNGGSRKVRAGKIAAQVAHASMSAILGDHPDVSGGFVPINVGEALRQWLLGSSTKVVVQVSTEDELLAVYHKAVSAGVRCSLIQDSGRTEFNGIPTYTCVAVGPEYADAVDSITGDLPLL